MSYLYYFLFSCVLAALCTPLVKRIALKTGAMDIPRPPRNLHKNPTPKLGVLAVFISFVLSIGVYWVSSGIDHHIVPVKFLVGILIGVVLLMIGGFLDDKYDLSPKVLWLFPAAASFAVVFSGIGIGITFLSNPFGDPINLSSSLLGVPISGIVMWFWLMGMMFTTKFLDGLDGLVSGIGLIAGLTLFFLSLSERVNQPITASFAIILCGALAGFLIYNFNPASIFLGDGGSLFVGFILAVLSIILGGKIATAFLVMGIPILDVAWVIVRRLYYKRSPFIGDRSHLHFRLLDLGFTQKQTVLILYALSAVFGFTALFLQNFGKLIALGVLFLLMIALAVGIVIMYKRKHPHIPDLFDKAD
jgi:UDP-GlcNAc:undecaprenyl-phosphate GlcNAc-1-phosphate transferase